jgi:hypothetical protein
VAVDKVLVCDKLCCMADTNPWDKSGESAIVGPNGPCQRIGSPEFDKLISVGPILPGVLHKKSTPRDKSGESAIVGPTVCCIKNQSDCHKKTYLFSFVLSLKQPNSGCHRHNCCSSFSMTQCCSSFTVLLAIGDASSTANSQVCLRFACAITFQCT